MRRRRRTVNFCSLSAKLLPKKTFRVICNFVSLLFAAVSLSSSLFYCLYYFSSFTRLPVDRARVKVPIFELKNCSSVRIEVYHTVQAASFLIHLHPRRPDSKSIHSVTQANQSCECNLSLPLLPPSFCVTLTFLSLSLLLLSSLFL